MKIGAISIGCDKNRVDTEKMLSRLTSGGHTLVGSEEEADVIIVNTGNGSGSNGHTAILEESYKDKGENAQIINEGGAGGSGGVNESSMRKAFGSMLDSGTVVFARPVKK